MFLREQQAEAANCARYKLGEQQLRAVRRVGLRLPHECREVEAAKKEAAAFEDEDVLFEEGVSLEELGGVAKLYRRIIRLSPTIANVYGL